MNNHISKKRNYFGRYGVGVVASTLFVIATPQQALACSWWDVPCHAREKADQARREAQRLIDEAAAAAEQAKRLAEAEANRLARLAMDEALNSAFSQLRNAGLGVLASTSALTDPDMWLREVTKAMLQDMSGQTLVDGADFVRGQLGNFSATAPFGDGPAGRQLELEVKKAYQTALQQSKNAATQSIDYLNPLKNQIVASPEDLAIAKSMYFFDIPSSMRFNYGTSFQTKVDVLVDPVDKRIPANLKGGVQMSFPLLWGDNKGASTIFVNAVNDKKFKFQVGLSWGLQSKKWDYYTTDPKGSFMGLMNFDVTCSTVNIGMCQLTKISSKLKLEGQIKTTSGQTGKYTKPMTDILKAAKYLPQFGIITTSQTENLVAVINNLQSSLQQPEKIVNAFTNMQFVSNSTEKNISKRHGDMGGLAMILGAMNAIPLPSSDYWKKNATWNTSGKKVGFSIDDFESIDLSQIAEFYNADAVNNIFTPGFKVIGGSNPLPDVAGYELTLKVGTEAKLKLSSPDPMNASQSEVSFSGNVNTGATLGAVFPLKTLFMNNLDVLKNQWNNTGVSGDMKNIMNSDARSFPDRIDLSASKLWSSQPELQPLITQVPGATDRLTLPVAMVVNGL